MSTIKKNVPIQFGLVSFTGTIVSAVETVAKDSHRYCVGAEGAEHGPARITARFLCTSEGCEQTSDWLTGVERDGKVTLLTTEDLAELERPELGQRIELRVYSREQVMAATLPGDTAYFLAPGQGSDGPYKLVTELIRSNPDKALVAMFKPRSNHQVRLWLLTISGSALVMQSLHWPQDIKAAPAVPDFPVDAKLLTMAQRALKALTERRFDVSEYRDPVRQSKEELLAAKAGDSLQVEGAQVTPIAVPTDLFAALQATTKAATASRRRKSPAA